MIYVCIILYIYICTNPRTLTYGITMFPDKTTLILHQSKFSGLEARLLIESHSILDTNHGIGPTIQQICADGAGL